MWHLQAAEASLRELNIYEPDPAIYNSVLSKVRIASLDCYIREVSHTFLQHAINAAFAFTLLLFGATLYSYISIVTCTSFGTLGLMQLESHFRHNNKLGAVVHWDLTVQHATLPSSC
jgi:hypothetical protein